MLWGDCRDIQKVHVNQIKNIFVGCFIIQEYKTNHKEKKKIPAVITFHCVYRYIFSGNTICCCIQTPRTVIKVMRTVQFSSLETKANIYNMYIKCTSICRVVYPDWNFDFILFFSFCSLTVFFIWGGGVSS